MTDDEHTHSGLLVLPDLVQKTLIDCFCVGTMRNIVKDTELRRDWLWIIQHDKYWQNEKGNCRQGRRFDAPLFVRIRELDCYQVSWYESPIEQDARLDRLGNRCKFAREKGCQYSSLRSRKDADCSVCLENFQVAYVKILIGNGLKL